MAEPPADWKPLLGQKVSIRYRLLDDPEHPFSEAVGIVMGVDGSGDDALVSIVKRTGQVVETRAGDILAAKRF